ncbi:MAG: hypothetical protein IKA90_05110 [Clostridia bacterium]|nr:hypothetical protein [Clostridia bacterium]
MRKNIENVLMAVVVATVIIAALGYILTIKAMTTVALVILTLTVGCFAGLQVADFLSKETVRETADKQVNKKLLIYMIVAVVLFLALLTVTIFHLYGKLF